MTQSQIIDRIRKLLALASNNPSPAEAASAAAMAQRLAFEAKLELASIEVDDEAPDAEPVTEETLLETHQRVNWASQLVSGIASANGCRTVYTWGILRGKRSRKLNILGRRTDVQTVAYLYGYLRGEIERLCKAGLQEQRQSLSLRLPISPRAWGNAFRLAAAATVVERLQRQRREDEAAMHQRTNADACTAMVRRDQAAVTAVVKERYPRLRSAPAATYTSSSGYAAGRRAGERISLRGGKGLGKAPGLLR